MLSLSKHEGKLTHHPGIRCGVQAYLKDCRWGRFLLLRGDMISEFVNLYGEWSEGEISLFRDLVPADGNVVEIGANIGTHTVPLSLICEKGKVLCYEPQRVIFQILCANAALNNRLNIFARQCAVGRRDGRIEIQSSDYAEVWNYSAFSLAAGFNAEGRFPGTVRKETVEMTALDGDPLVGGLDRLDLVKIDAEGAERDVLDGARETLTRHKPFVFVENNSEKNSPAVLEALRALNYACYWFCSSRYRKNNFNKVFWKVDGTDANMLCVPPGAASPRALVPVASFADLRTGKVPVYE